MPDFDPIRAHLDANILFSASHSERNRFLQFWQMEDVTPATSRYAIAEVRPHLKRIGQTGLFDALVARTQLVSDVDLRIIPSQIQLGAKNKPILAAAIGARMDYLVTGDKNHFGHLYNTILLNVYIISPTDFLDRHFERLIDGAVA